jgi:hypothetical protein
MDLFELKSGLLTFAARSDVRLAALKALALIAPHGHDQTTRRVLMVLRNSWQVLIRDFTGCARDADAPHQGSARDYGLSRGPISLGTQLQAIAREAPGRCPAKCGETAAAVRIAAIEVLVAIAVKRSDLAARREELLATVCKALPRRPPLPCAMLSMISKYPVRHQGSRGARRHGTSVC